MEIPTYEMLIDNETVDGVFAMSLVESPAILTDYILLSKDNNKINIELSLQKLADEKRHIVSGIALIPDMLIPRKGFNITFSKETVRKISENFLMKGYKDNVTLQHQVSVSGVYLVESWIVDDPENDKSNAIGLEAPKGSWCISMKITDDNLWNEFIGSGVLKGFSLEGNFSQREIEMCNHEEDEIDDELRKIYLAINYSISDLDS